MADGLFDIKSWKRSSGPSFRAFIYFTVIYVILVIILLIPNWILLSLGIDLSEIFSFLITVSMVFAFFLSFFKVLDEERPGEVPLQMI